MVITVMVITVANIQVYFNILKSCGRKNDLILSEEIKYEIDLG